MVHHVGLHIYLALPAQAEPQADMKKKWSVDSTLGKIPGNFLRFLANALFNGDLFSNSQTSFAISLEEAIMDYRLEMMFVRPFKQF